ncbi:MAG: hypothetical protein KAS04_07250, partial [Candidatus Aenigmarchaeota archaeon]|nr:hypothetical protein [Candidatus Aenigmarchaeota archaeon]
LENSQLKRDIPVDDALQVLRDIEQQTKWDIFDMIRNIQSNIIKSCSVTKDAPRTSLYLYGRRREISITFETGKKEAKMLIPKNVNIPEKKD